MRKALLLGSCSLGAALLVQPLHAQEIAAPTVDQAERKLATVTVTATKREESLQDVPIAVSVIGGDELEANAISTLEDASSMIPNVTVAEGSVADSVFIRGIGSGVNIGFEQSVGTFIDGVYYGQSRSTRNPFFDLARVEVLKGPQATLSVVPAASCRSSTSWTSRTPCAPKTHACGGLRPRRRVARRSTGRNVAT